MATFEFANQTESRPEMDKPQRHMAGANPEKKTLVDNRVWFGAKLALWRSKVGWEIVLKQAAEIVGRCAHADGCPAESDETEPCLDGCPDREVRMSALVILSAARQSEPVSASKLAEQPYSMPSREYFASVVAELAACQAELEVLRGTVITMPPANDPPQLKEKSAS
jgi:hypothetical protein